MEFPTLQGKFVSWSDINVRGAIYGGTTFRTSDWAAVDWSHGLEPGVIRGTGPTVLGHTTGEYSAEGSMTMWYDAGINFTRALSASGLPTVGYMRKKFDLVIQFEPKDEPGLVFTTKLLGCRIKGEQVSNAIGPEGTQIVFPLAILRVEMDGRSAI